MKNSGLIKLPETCGLIFFKKGQQVIYIDKASNIRRYAELVHEYSHNDSILADMLSSCDNLDWQVTESMFIAMAEQKIFLKHTNPEFQQQINLKKGYSYLVIDYFDVPFIKTKQTTEEDYLYIGPFKSQFEIFDITSAFMEFFSTPACESEEFPCDHYKTKKCYGYCLQNEKTKLYNDINQYYLSNCSDSLKPIIAKREALLNELKFQEALYYDKFLDVIKKYQDKLTFLRNIKTLCSKIVICDREYTITNGFITKIINVVNQQVIAEFFEVHPDYRENELLAVDKTHYDELWLNYLILKKE